MNLLIVEDETKTATALARGLRERGYTCEVTGDGAHGLTLALSGSFHLILLDIMLPSLDGVQLVEEVRAAGSTVPILLLTALDGVNDRVRGLRAGADDYLIKPFALVEVAARIEAVLRRTRSLAPVEQATVGDLTIHFTQQRVERAGRSIDVTPTELRLLSVLAENAGRPVQRRELSRRAMGVDFDSETNAVDVAIRRLRAKVDEPFAIRLIQTVRSSGYALIPPQ